MADESQPGAPAKAVRPGRFALRARRLLLPPTLAILAVVIGIGAANLVHGDPSAGSGINPRPPTPDGASSLDPAQPNAASGGPAAGTTSPVTTPTPSATPSPRVPPSPSVPPSLRQVPVFVYNATGVQGAAARMQGLVRAAGWSCDHVTEVSLDLASTTVFYDSGQEASAKALMTSVAAIKAVAPRPRILVDTGTLIVVVEADFAG